jgi:hypothetical protein
MPLGGLDGFIEAKVGRSTKLKLNKKKAEREGLIPLNRLDKRIKEEVRNHPELASLKQKEKIRFSHNKLSIWLHCHQRYKLYYLDGLQTKRKAENLQIGVVVHDLLKLWNDKKLTSSDISNLESYVQKLFSFNEGDESLTIAREAARLVVGYIKQYERDPLKVISSEVHVQQELPDYILYGRIDGLSRTQDDRLWRLEYKTAKRIDNYYLNGLKAGLQGAIYDFLIEEHFKEKLTGTIYSMLVKTTVPQFPRAFSPISRPGIRRMHETCQGVLRDIQRGDFYPSSACLNYGRDCEFKILCDNDTPDNREAFYTTRPAEESLEKEKGGEQEDV